jgi:phosphinothricin acetyltransferase
LRPASTETAHYKLPDRHIPQAGNKPGLTHVMSPLLIRPSTPEDFPAIARIYAHHVLHGTATFETEPPSPEEMLRRRDEVLARGWPWLTAERGGVVLGYAYANQLRPRPAFRFCLEDSIYLDQAAHGQGVGRALLVELLAQCEARGARQVVAVIGDSANAASIGLHRACGFEPSGGYAAAGWKFERWIDVVLMQRALGEGSATPAREHA